MENKRVEISVRGVIKDDLIFSTSTGIYVYLAGKKTAKKLVSGKYYGLVKSRKGWLAARSNEYKDKPQRSSDISLLTMKNDQIMNIRPLLYGIPGEVHQVDIIEGKLTFPHTGYGQLLRVEVEKLISSRRPLTIFDCEHRTLGLGRQAHVNSIYFYRNTIYLVAHNLTQHTGKPSQLVEVGREGVGEKRIIETGAISAHNVIVDARGDYLYCDSGRGILRKNLQAKFKAGKLLRGLSISDERNIYVGGSDITFDREKRLSSEATIYALNRHFKLIGQLDLPGVGNIYGVRQFRGRDLGMSRDEEWQTARDVVRTAVS